MTICVGGTTIKDLKLGDNAITAYLGEKKIRPTGISGDIMHYRRDGNYNNSASDQYHLTEYTTNARGESIEFKSTSPGGKYVKVYKARLYTPLSGQTQDIGTITLRQKNDGSSMDRKLSSDDISISINNRSIVSIIAGGGGLDEFSYNNNGYDTIYGRSCISILLKYGVINGSDVIHADIYRNGLNAMGVYGRRTRGGITANIKFSNYLMLGYGTYTECNFGEIIVDSNRWDDSKIQEYYNSTKHLYVN